MASVATKREVRAPSTPLRKRSRRSRRRWAALFSSLACACSSHETASTSGEVPKAPTSASAAGLDAGVASPSDQEGISLAKPAALDWEPWTIDVQPVRGPVVWMTVGNSAAKHAAVCSWDPGKSFACSSLPADLANSTPIAGLGHAATSPLFHLSELETHHEDAVFDRTGQEIAPAGDWLATVLDDGTIVGRDGLTQPSGAIPPSIVRYVGPTKIPTQSVLAPRGTAELVGNEVFYSQADGSRFAIHARLLGDKGEPGAESKLASISFEPESTDTRGCVDDHGTTALFMKGSKDGGKHTAKGAVVFHSADEWRGPFEFSVAVDPDERPKDLVHPFELVDVGVKHEGGVQCSSEELTWVAVDRHALRRVACTPRGCSVKEAPLPASFFAHDVTTVESAAIGDKVLIVEDGARFRIAPLDAIADAPTRHLVDPSKAGIVSSSFVLVAARNRALVLVNLVKPEQLRAVEIDVDGHLHDIAP